MTPAQRLAEWLKSPEGQEAMAKAAEATRKRTEAERKAHRVTPELLRKCVTL